MVLVLCRVTPTPFYRRLVHLFRSFNRKAERPKVRKLVLPETFLLPEHLQVHQVVLTLTSDTGHLLGFRHEQLVRRCHRNKELFDTEVRVRHLEDFMFSQSFIFIIILQTPLC